MPSPKRLIVGLGNPGAEYAETRHNVGFMVLDAIAEETGIGLGYGRDDALVGWGVHAGRELGLALPLAYMNRSGRVVGALLRRFELSPDDLLVVYDDLNLDVGRLRLRERGSAGGHNGVQDIIDRLGTDAFPRLRVGIGSDFERGGQVDYVLAPFSEEQLPQVEAAIRGARDAALTFVAEGLVPAMNRFNG